MLLQIAHLDYVNHKIAFFCYMKDEEKNNEFRFKTLLNNVQILSSTGTNQSSKRQKGFISEFVAKLTVLVKKRERTINCLTYLRFV